MPTDQSYLAPARFSKSGLLGTLWAGVAISFCFLLFRFYVRLKIFRQFHTEDPFVLAAWLMNLAYAVLWQNVANKLYAVVAVESGQIQMPPLEYISCVYVELHSLLASFLLYYTALWSIKLSFLLFFRNLCNSIRRQMILWYCVLGYTIMSYITCLCMIDYRCLAKPGGLPRCERDSYHYTPTVLRLATAFDTTTDALIILISTNILWNASVELRKKLALTGIFCLTAFIIGFSIVRVVLTTSGSRLDVTWLLLWSGLEMTVAIIVACIASFRILYARSERSRRSALSGAHTNRPAGFMSEGPSIPLNARLVQPIPMNVIENTRHQRPTSTDTFEEAILPMDNGYAQHRYSILSRPREMYEEIRSALESPIVRFHSHRRPSHAINGDTLSNEFRHPGY